MAQLSLSDLNLNLHKKCRNATYSEGPQRLPVPDDKVPWTTDFEAYKPVDYTSAKVLAGPAYADSWDPVAIKKFKFNGFEKDGLMRVSFEGPYNIIEDLPRNPKGRTGMTGRGRLGRFGPNHAADPIVTRFKRNDKGELLKDARGKKMLEAVLIKRKDTGEWAIPGGMVETGDSVSETLSKEFAEEAMAKLELTKELQVKVQRDIKDLFAKAQNIPVYEGYVDDPRNTDNAWMETVAVNFHDADGTTVGAFKLKAGDDAVGAQWTVVTAETKLYASHSDFIRRVLAIHGLD